VGIALVIVAVVILGGLVFANGPVRLCVQRDTPWSDSNVQHEGRHDLTGNVLETVKGYATHEREALDGVMTARARAMGAQVPAAKAEGGSLKP
jgi:LemA protein